MEPPHNADPVPVLPQDLVDEILIRLPPIEPACLVRASLVCKPWRRLISGASFLRRYRVFHRTPPMLGVIHAGCELSDSEYGSRVIRTTSRSPVDPKYLNWMPLDCRHGRALFDNKRKRWSHGFSLVVWDPMTGGRHGMHEPGYFYTHSTAAVLCAVGHGCDHLACQGGPFLVVFVGSNMLEEEEDVTWACVYSSDTGEWSAPAYVNHNCFVNVKPSVLVGGAVYFLCSCGDEIFRYDLAKHVITVVHRPPGQYDDMVLVAAEDRGLAFAGLVDDVSRHDKGLHVWSKEEASGWVRRGGIIDLRGMLIPSQDSLHPLKLLGSVEGRDSILLGADHGVFTVGLRSGQMGKKVCERRNSFPIFPYMSFCTPGVLPDSDP